LSAFLGAFSRLGRFLFARLLVCLLAWPDRRNDCSLFRQRRWGFAGCRASALSFSSPASPLRRAGKVSLERPVPSAGRHLVLAGNAYLDVLHRCFGSSSMTIGRTTAASPANATAPDEAATRPFLELQLRVR
jgi:hypothetical protein